MGIEVSKTSTATIKLDGENTKPLETAEGGVFMVASIVVTSNEIETIVKACNADGDICQEWSDISFGMITGMPRWIKEITQNALASDGFAGF